jgi:hypothetical protein
MSEQVVEGYGARLAISAPDSDSLARLVAGLSPGWEPTGGAPDSTAWRITVSTDDAGYVVREETLGDTTATDSNGVRPPPSAGTSCSDLEQAIDFICDRIRLNVGYHTRDRVFVHAGVVTHRDRAIVIPGDSFSGKSTLVAALVRAGAAYYSDEYAVFDENGQVHPYLEPPALRNGDGRRARAVTLESLGGTSGDGPAAMGVLAVTRYVAGSEWSPRSCSTGEGVVALMEHAATARNVPRKTLGTMRRALRGAVILKGTRGEAEATAAALLGAVDGLGRGPRSDA